MSGLNSCNLNHERQIQSYYSGENILLLDVGFPLLYMGGIAGYLSRLEVGLTVINRQTGKVWDRLAVGIPSLKRSQQCQIKASHPWCTNTVTTFPDLAPWPGFTSQEQGCLTQKSSAPTAQRVRNITSIYITHSLRSPLLPPTCCTTRESR